MEHKDTCDDSRVLDARSLLRRILSFEFERQEH